jgi:hypothetical protein
MGQSTDPTADLRAVVEAVHRVDCGCTTPDRHTPEVWPHYEEIATAAVEAMAGARYEVIERLRNRVAEYERMINWGVTCSGCADRLDALIAARDAGHAEGVRDAEARVRAQIAEEVRGYGRRLRAQPWERGLAAVIDRLAERIAEGRVPADPPRHRYLSTACHHGEHDYCAAPLRPDGTEKKPATCKFCEARCVCPCHADQPTEESTDEH